MNRTTWAAMACLILALTSSGLTVAADDGGARGATSDSCPLYRLHALGGSTDEGATLPYPMKHWGGDARVPLADYLRELDLSLEQRQSMQEIAQRFRDRAVALMQRGAEARDRLRSVMPDDAAYADAVTTAAQSAAVLAADGVRLLGDMRAEMHAVLTDAQRQLLREKVREDRQRWDEWRSRHQSQQ